MLEKVRWCHDTLVQVTVTWGVRRPRPSRWSPPTCSSMSVLDEVFRLLAARMPAGGLFAFGGGMHRGGAA
jgi:hypothetical protein